MDRNKDKEILKPLIERLLEIAARPSEARKKKLWADHQALKPVERPPVCVYYEGMPDPEWDRITGPFSCKTPAGLSLEKDLKKRLWMAENVPDDNIVWPFVTVLAVVSKAVDWGVQVTWHESAGAGGLGARKAESPFKDGIDLNKLKFSDMQIDEAATALFVEEVSELCLGKLPVFVKYATLGASPFDKATELRGMEEILFDCIDNPEKVKGLMEFLTVSLISHHKAREAKGHLNVATLDGKYAAFGWRVPSFYLPQDFDAAKPKLKNEWFYVSAQTSSGLGPDMYAEFVYPYACRLAELMTDKTVYYHGCEMLDQKYGILKTLPNLRRVHVSPWSNTAAAAEAFKKNAVLEIHSHPGKVFFGFSKEDMMNEILAKIGPAKGLHFDINLSDIHSVNSDQLLLKKWAEAAKEAMTGN